MQNGTPVDAASAAGLLGCVAELADQREYLVQAKTVPALLRVLEEGTYSGRTGAAQALRLIAEHPDARKRLVKELDLEPLVGVIKDATNPANARRDCAHCLHRVSMGPTEEAQRCRAALGNNGGIEALVQLLREGPLDAQEPASGALCNAATLEENKQPLVDAGGIAPIVGVVGTEEVPLPGRASAAGVLWHLTTAHVDVETRDPPTVNLEPRGRIPAGFGEVPPPTASTHRLRMRQLEPPNMPQKLALTGMDRRIELIMEAGGVKPLVNLLSPPSGDDAGAGGKKKKKGKKGKAPPLPPGMDAAQKHAAGALRHIALH